jgi:2-methylcitrate dehydratase PrpD
MAQFQPTRALAAFAANLDARSLPGAVREKLGWLLLDYLRVCSIGARLPWSDWARAYAEGVARPGASHVLFTPDALNPEHATFLNVAFGSSFDADDTHVGAMLHPGVAAWAAAFAIAEYVGASGPDVAAAVAAAYETTIRIGLAIQPGHFRRGFQSTGTCNVFGVAAAASRLLFAGRDAERRILGVLGLAGGYPSGVAQFYFSGASAKRIQAAHAARSGVAAALLVQQGFAGPPDIIEGAAGFARAYADAFDSSAIADGLGERFHLMDVLVKSHAAAARVAAGIEAMLALRAEHRFTAKDIGSIVLGIPRIIEGRLTNRHPADLQAAQMSLPFSVALAARAMLVRGEATILSVEDYQAGLADQTIFEIEERTTIDIDDEAEAVSNAHSTAVRVTMTLHDGRVLTRLVHAPKGSAGNPFTGAEHERRFVQELSRRVPERVCAEIVDMSKDLSHLDPRWVMQVLSEDPEAGG